jgi:LacI family transcriptional regulator
MTARYVQPGLTTVRQPVRELGALAADRLHARIVGTAGAPTYQQIPTELVLRSSCGCSQPSPPRRPKPSPEGGPSGRPPRRPPRRG